MEQKKYTTAIILAAGMGTRFGADVPKHRLSLFGKSLISRVAKSFYDCDDIDSIVVVTREEDVDFVNSELLFLGDKLYKVISGGSSRSESAKLGFLSIPAETEYVAIHDGARCLITPDDISRVANAAYVSGAATAASLIVDTVKRVKDNRIKGTVSRDELILASTPQIFSVDIYKNAIKNVSYTSSITDDNMLVEKTGKDITAVILKNENIKITYPKDLEYAEFILNRREKQCLDSE